MSQRRVYLETFGCQMNELDSELVAGQLRALGYKFVPQADDADVVLYNTCSVREQAEQKVWSRLGELKHRKAEQPTLVVGVLGCMAERDGVDLIKRMPVVDVMCGPGELDKLPTLLDNAVRTRESLLSESGTPAFQAGRATQVSISSMSANQVALQGNSSRRSATLAAAEDTLELLDLSRAISPVDSDAFAGDGSALSGRHTLGESVLPGRLTHGVAEVPKAAIRRSAYVRITRGCNKFCTYCVVPFTRGAEIHRPPEHIIDECKKLADAGVIEITLLGQTVNHYRFEHGAAVTMHGVMQPQKGRAFTGGHRRDPLGGLGANVTTFADLLRRIHDEVPAIQRLRFVTSYPRDFGDDVLEVMRDHPRMCRYLHVPAQSGSNRMLKAMNRGYTVEEYDEFLDRARAMLDEPEKGRPLMLSGDFIVGFPGETDEDYELTKRLVERARYKNAFIFKYSPRPGTIAFDKLADDVPEAVKRARNNELLALQNKISHEISTQQVGRTFDVIIEGLSPRSMKKKGVTQGQMRAKGQVAITIGGRSLARGAAATLDADPGHDHSHCEDHHDHSDHPDHNGACNSGSHVFSPTAADAAEQMTGAEPVQLACRTDGDLIVFVEAMPTQAQKLIGQLAKVRIDSADQLALHGTLV
ncbi:MAG: MiaB/RimO family radical SAM methylthiotransferase [Phycisphaerales bacterium]